MKNFKKASIILSCAVALAVIACAVCVVSLIVNGARTDLLNGKDNNEYVASDAELAPTYDYGQAYIDSIVFISDMTLSSTEFSALLRDSSQVWSGIEGSFPLDYNTDTANVIYSEDGKKGTVALATEEYKPQYVVITVGLENGVAHCSKEKFQEYYSKIIDAIKSASPSTKIILQSVFPTSKQVAKDTPNISGKKISIANLWIAELAQIKSVKYLNTASALSDKQGNLKSEYDSGDGIHLNLDGYTAVLHYIRTHGYK